MTDLAAQDLISTGGLQLVAGGLDGGGGDVGQYASLKIDSDGGQHVAYYDATFRQLKYAHRISAAESWNIQTVTSNSPRGQHASLAVGARQNVVTTATLTATSQTVTIVEGLVVSPLLVGARLTSGTINHIISGIDAELGTLTLSTPYTGPTGDFPVNVSFYQPVISFQGGVSPRQLYVARPNGQGDWFVEVVDGANVGTGSTFTGFDTSVVVDETGIIHVAYRDGRTSGGMTNQLRYARYDGGQWEYETPNNGASDGFGNKMIVDKRGVPIIIHLNYLQDGLLASVRDNASSDSWTVSVLDPSPLAGRGINATYHAASDNVFATYSERVTSPTATSRLKMVAAGFSQEDGWELNYIQLMESQGIGPFTDVAVQPFLGWLQLVYFNDQDRKLVGISANSVAMIGIAPVRTIDEGGDVGRYNSVAFTPLALESFAAYYDATRQALKVAKIPFSGAATTEFVDGIKYGTDSAVGRTSTHNVIAYHSTTEGTVRVARWPIGDNPETSAAFEDVVIDNSSESVGESLAMAIDGNDTLYLAYYDRTNKALRAAVVFDDLATTNSEIAGLDDGLVVGPYVDIAVNGDTPAQATRVAIAFYVESVEDEEGLTLYYAENRNLPAVNDGTWQLNFEVSPALPGQSNAGRFCSLVYDSSDNLHFAFFIDSLLAPGYAMVNPAGNSSGGEPIESSLFINGGQETSIAINPRTNRPAVAYYDISNAGLKYAELGDEGWSVTEVDLAGDTGHGPQLMFDRERNIVRIAYHDQAGGQLRVASRPLGTTTDWQPVTVLGETHGFSPSAILNEDGTLTLSFHQRSSGNLWTATTVFIELLNSASQAWLEVK